MPGAGAVLPVAVGVVAPVPSATPAPPPAPPVISSSGRKEQLGPGGLASREVELPAGAYRLVCSLPGHEGLGMTATLTVEAA